MRQLIILLAICTIAYGQQNTKKYSILFDTPSVYAYDYNGSNEYISVTPALRLTGKYASQKTTISADSGFVSNQAYGAWSFTVNKDLDGNAIDVYIISSLNSASGSGWLIRYGTDEKVYLMEVASGTPTARITSSGTYAIQTAHTIRATRNTNGAWSVLVNGTSIGTYTGATHTFSNYSYIDLGAGDVVSSLVYEQGEGSLDLNSYEKVYHSDNRTAESKVAFAWVGKGTHTADTSSRDDRTGSYSIMVRGTGAGDSTANYVGLPVSAFEMLVSGEKYTLEFWTKIQTTGTVCTLSVGNQIKVSPALSTSAYTKVVWNFQANSSEQDTIKIYLSQADSVYIDDFSVTKSYDMLALMWYNVTDMSTTATLRGGFEKGNWNQDRSYGVFKSTTGRVSAYFTNTGLSRVSLAIEPLTAGWTLTGFYVNRVTNAQGIYNGALQSGTSIQGIGALNGVYTFEVGRAFTSAYQLGYIGHLQLIKFDDITASNVSSANILTASNRGKLKLGEWTGGGAYEALFLDYKGGTTTLSLTDKAGVQGEFTGTNIDISDRVKAGAKFK